MKARLFHLLFNASHNACEVEELRTKIFWLQGLRRINSHHHEILIRIYLCGRDRDVLFGCKAFRYRHLKALENLSSYTKTHVWKRLLAIPQLRRILWSLTAAADFLFPFFLSYPSVLRKPFHSSFHLPVRLDMPFLSHTLHSQHLV